MSLIQQIKSRTLQDLINEGARCHLTGPLAAGSDQVVVNVPADRFFVITGYHFSSDSATPILVSLGLKSSGATTEVFRGYVGNGMVVDKVLSFMDWVYGDLDYDVVVSFYGTVAYTISGRISSSPVPLGYIEQIGTKNHANPYFGLPSGDARGQSEF
jgi:hypothetical protein